MPSNFIPGDNRFWLGILGACRPGDPLNRRHQVRQAMEEAWSSWSSGEDQFLSTLDSSSGFVL